MQKETKEIATVPEGYTSVTPWIISRSTPEMIDFLVSAFEAKEIPNSRIANEDGIIIHAVVQIGNTKVMLFDSRQGWAPSPSFLNIYVADIESTQKKCLALGAKSMTEITALWFGEKVCRILDPFGNLIWINQRVEEVDFTDAKEIGQRSSTPEAVEGIKYIQQSLDEAFRTQRDFLKI